MSGLAKYVEPGSVVQQAAQLVPVDTDDQQTLALKNERYIEVLKARMLGEASAITHPIAYDDRILSKLQEYWDTHPISHTVNHTTNHTVIVDNSVRINIDKSKPRDVNIDPPKVGYDFGWLLTGFGVVALVMFLVALVNAQTAEKLHYQPTYTQQQRGSL